MPDSRSPMKKKPKPSRPDPPPRVFSDHYLSYQRQMALALAPAVAQAFLGSGDAWDSYEDAAETLDMMADVFASRTYRV